MKKFSFKLAKVAETKTIQVKQKSLELAEMLRSLESEEMEFNRMSNELEILHEEVLQQSVNGCSAKELRDYQRYINKVSAEIRDQKNSMDKIQDKIEELQVGLTELSKEKEVLEKLREKRYLKHLKEQIREEQKMLDEMTLITKGIKNLL